MGVNLSRCDSVIERIVYGARDVAAWPPRYERRQRSFPIALNLLTPSCPRSFLAFEPGADSAARTPRSFRLMDLRGVKVFVQENHEHGIPILRHIYGAEVLARLAVRKQAATLHQETTN